MFSRVVSTRLFWVVAATLLALALAHSSRGSYLEHVADRLALDASMRFEAKNRAAMAVAPIVFIRATDEDIASFGWPLDPQVMQAVLSLVLSKAPAAVGLISPLNEKLHGQVTSLKDSRVIVATEAELPSTGLAGVKQLPLRLQVDPDGVVRRAELLETGANQSQNLITHLALLWAAHAGVPYDASETQFRVGNTRIKRLHRDFSDASYHSWQALPFYSGTSQNLPSISISELLSNPTLAAHTAGRVVLIGNMSENYASRYPTPLASNLLAKYGVLTAPEIVGEQLSTLLGADSFGRTSYISLSDELITAVLITLAVLLAALYLLIANTRGQLLIMLVSSSVVVTGWTVGYLLGVLLPLFVPLLLVVTQYVGQAIASASVEYSNRRALGNMLSRHLSEQVAQELWRKRHKISDDGVIPTAKTTATVLFADVVGFTRLSEQMEPEALVSWLNRMLTEVTRAINANGGTVDKFIGDAVMAVFGVPDFAQNEKQLRKQVDNAIKATLTIRERLMALNGELAAKGLPAFQMRIGLHTGELVAGEIGSIDKTNYTVIGDTVNVAARIESKCSEYASEGEAVTVLLSEQTQQLASVKVHYDELGTQYVKGRGEPIKMYRLNPASGALIKEMENSAPNAEQVKAAISYMADSSEVDSEGSVAEPSTSQANAERVDEDKLGQATPVMQT